MLNKFPIVALPRINSVIARNQCTYNPVSITQNSELSKCNVAGGDCVYPGPERAPIPNANSNPN